MGVHDKDPVVEQLLQCDIHPIDRNTRSDSDPPGIGLGLTPYEHVQDRVDVLMQAKRGHLTIAESEPARESSRQSRRRTVSSSHDAQQSGVMHAEVRSEGAERIP